MNLNHKQSPKRLSRINHYKSCPFLFPHGAASMQKPSSESASDCSVSGVHVIHIQRLVPFVQHALQFYTSSIITNLHKTEHYTSEMTSAESQNFSSISFCIPYAFWPVFLYFSTEMPYFNICCLTFLFFS